VASLDVEVVPERADGEVARALVHRYYEEMNARFPGGFDLQLTEGTPAAEPGLPAATFLVAYIDAHPSGCGSVRRLDEGTAEIKRMWVDPTTRGRGVGRELLGALEAVAIGWGCDVVRLDTNAVLAEALALYRSSGYRSIASYNDNPFASEWFEKRLL
jgi:GNAT superfamily N-acetyltransferase